MTTTPASVLTHNGCMTIQNTNRGTHRTFRIKTQNEHSRFAPNQRILAVMVGPDNEASYQPFAFVNAQGIWLWSRYQGNPLYEKYRWMLLDPQRFEAKGARYMFDTRCRVCNRRLTNPDSIDSGIGPKCAKGVAA